MCCLSVFLAFIIFIIIFCLFCSHLPKIYQAFLMSATLSEVSNIVYIKSFYFFFEIC